MNLKNLKPLAVVLLAALAITPVAVVAGPSSSEADAGYPNGTLGKGKDVEFKVVGDAGVPTPPKQFDPSERRDELKLLTEALREAVASQLKKPVTLKPILFAEQFNDTKDAAIVIFVSEGKDTANFFFYGNGKWNIFPADFTAK